MNFFELFFNDEAPIVGLCGFNFIKAGCKKPKLEPDLFFNPYKCEKSFETNFKRNTLLL